MTHPIRLTYVILDGNGVGAFGRLTIPYASDYRLLVGLDLIELLKKEVKWEERKNSVRLYRTDITESTAYTLIMGFKDDPYDPPKIPGTRVQQMDKLVDHWASSPEPDKVHLIIQVMDEVDSFSQFIDYY
ncbi:hypothetical protein RhiJN_06479 [Ceratobasidium sp. AG-Ba]|nr:hypothetical protein RhiJN_06479 [Ceratobasidium sp. AG-Ba]QRW07398.1 hypothetical protein RhiLY_06397 [Ceratobasidium sp. AG-Ba]